MQIQFANKKALVRVDFNVPFDKAMNVTDDTRLRGAVPTIKHILQAGGAVILMSHLGRPLKKLKEDGTIDREKFSLKHVVNSLSALLGTPVQFADDCVGEVAETAVAKLQFGEVLLLENTRFHAGEEKGDRALAEQMAKLGDVYVNDAFGAAHRAHSSTTTVAEFFAKDAKCFGYLMESELKNASKLLNNAERPLTAIIGGAKVSDKIMLLERLIDFADQLIIGGGMAYTFFKAQGGQTGNSLVEADKLDLALALLEKAKAKGVKIFLPSDSVIADAFAENANTQVSASGQVPDGWMGLDIGPDAQKSFEAVILASKSIFWNGPMGVFEMSAFAQGTRRIAEAVAKATSQGAYSLVGGGDSVAAVNQMGLDDEVSYVSTGGGAMLELLEGKVLPGVAAIEG